MSDAIKKVAVLIDAENISPKYAQLILDEAKNIGNVVCRRIYGDWSSTSLSSWKTPIMDFSINAIQQFNNTTGKNSSDSALIINAMDLLHEGKYQCICIVSSDSDFTRLASRIREEEIYVVGMGEKKTPASFRSACDKFLYLDILYRQNNSEKEKISEAFENEDNNEQIEKEEEIYINGLDQKIVTTVIDEIIDSKSDDDGWIGLATIGSLLSRKITDFDVRNFGCKNLTDFIQSLGVYEIRKESQSSNPNTKVVSIRKKRIDK